MDRLDIKMTRPVINDTKALIELAIIIKQGSYLKFAPAFRELLRTKPELIINHSLDSTRKRYQVKYNANKNYWHQKANEELDRRRKEAIEEFHQNAFAALHEAGQMVERMQPAIDEMHARLNSPGFQQFLDDAAKLSNQMHNAVGGIAVQMQRHSRVINRAMRVHNFSHLKQIK